ncbi:ABC transporter permease [Paenibacillus sp. FSL W8-0187]|uniref:ABC transporter permease n=1 Tax=unclassified Paenibacillus TaxID=185978 RepID=UPI0030D8B73C
MFLALRELRHAKLRYLLIGFIMVLIAWLVLFVTGLAQGLSSDNASSIQNMKADYLVLQEESDHRINRSILTEELWTEVRSHPGGNKATPLGVHMNTLTKEGSTAKFDAAFFAIDVESMLAPKVVEGTMINNTDADHVMADRSLKDDGYQLGDRIVDQATGATYTIAAFTEGQSYSHAPVIHMNFEGWKALQPRSAKQEPIYSAIVLNGSPEQKETLARDISGIEIMTKDEALQGIPGFKEEQGSLIMMIVFLFVIAAFVLAVFFYVITIQKMNQFGVLKAIGAGTGYLVRNLIFQVLTLTIVSLAISIGLTYGVSLLLSGIVPFSLPPSVVLLCSLLFLAVSLMGSLLSLYRVIKIDAIEAIGRAA